jgi:hypothetical protein
MVWTLMGDAITYQKKSKSAMEIKGEEGDGRVGQTVLYCLAENCPMRRISSSKRRAKAVPDHDVLSNNRNFSKGLGQDSWVFPKLQQGPEC